jgi:predicted proteasome-type protease
MTPERLAAIAETRIGRTLIAETNDYSQAVFGEVSRMIVAGDVTLRSARDIELLLDLAVRSTYGPALQTGLRIAIDDIARARQLDAWLLANMLGGDVLAHRDLDGQVATWRKAVR